MRDTEGARRGRWAVGAFFGANGFVMGAWAPQIPLILPRHQITETVLGLMILLLGIGAVGSMLFAGRLIARFGSRRVASAFALMAVPALPLIVLAPSPLVLALVMAGMGGIVGCMDVAMNSNAVVVERRLGRAIMSSSHGFWSLGGFVGGSAGSWVILHWGALAQAILTAGVSGAVILWSMRHLVEDEAAPSATTAADATASRGPLLPRDLSLWLLGMMALFSMVPEGAVLDWAALYLGKEMGADIFTAGLGFAFFAGTMALMRFLGDGVRNRLGAVQTLRLSGLMGAGGLVIAALAPVPWLAIPGFALSGLGVANMVPIVFSAAGNHPTLTSGQAISTVTMVGYAGILVAPASIGFVAEHFGYRQTYAALAVLLLVVAALASRAAAADQLRRLSPLGAAPGTDYAAGGIASGAPAE